MVCSCMRGRTEQDEEGFKRALHAARLELTHLCHAPQIQIGTALGERVVATAVAWPCAVMISTDKVWSVSGPPPL
jgi:hypothetical protein